MYTQLYGVYTNVTSKRRERHDHQKTTLTQQTISLFYYITYFDLLFLIRSFWRFQESKAVFEILVFT
jgi:hypothetical protein